jgi:hypothetical protein
MTNSMPCGRVRRLLWPDEGPRRTTMEVAAAQAHAASCEACRGFLEDMRALADGVRRAAPRPQAPPEVRERLFHAVARVRTTSGHAEPIRRNWRWGAVGLAATIGLLAMIRVLSPAGAGEEMAAAMVEDHLRVVTDEAIASSDSLVVARWLAGRLPLAVEVPLFPAARLTGARISALGERRAAVMQYELSGGRTLSYYVLPATAPDRHVAGMPTVRYDSHAGFRVAAWQDAGLTHALVGALSESQLAHLALYCMHQMLALAGSGGDPAVSADAG